MRQRAPHEAERACGKAALLPSERVILTRMEAAFGDPSLIMLGKLVLAGILGMLVGTERALLAKQAAGTRTFALVSIGACLFVLAGSFADAQLLGIVNFDPARMAASVVQGIGFLGAGLIIFRGESIHGVTTAAGLWVAAAVGVAVAFGMYAVAVFGTLLTLLILTAMWYLEWHLKERLAHLSGPMHDESGRIGG